MNISLAGKNFLVTGATGAIGRAVAEALAEGGGWVAGSYHRDETLARQLQAGGIRMFQADLTDRSSARSLVARVLEEARPTTGGQTGHLDGLVYAAGNTRDRTVAKLTDAEWDEVLALHVGGLFAAVQAVLPSMRARRAGKLVAVGSLSGSVGRVGQANYAAAKAATVGLIKSLAKEEGRFGVTAHVVCPGFIDSKMTRAAPARVWEQAQADSALGTVSSVEVVASFLVWLLSDLCQGVTGQVFQLDSRI